MTRVFVRIGRNPQGIEALWANPTETVAVVRSFHEPPRYVVFSRSSRGDQWMKDDDFASYGEAEKHARTLR